ncbi:hypothetical protein [Sandaracinus amylolyticus]|uniref:hypothetical protein n=1 Tax=Sandaracinus amylolyticus TaxID=927083 RepID=UPI001F2D1452|nr:hypothetical protein [Sandaracinus amylolyticus]UJR82521.1 Hypothetical protein I5071_45860 [Sandaracinus amylolyticus]
MTLPRPYSESDDEVVVDGCVRGDRDAYEVLETRHGPLAEVVMLRELGTAAESEHELEQMRDALWDHLARQGGAALRAWTPRESTLRAWLCVIARGVARRQAESSTTRASIVAFFPTPPVLHMRDVEAEQSAILVHDLLERLPPTSGALVRLRLRGMDREQIAAAVGQAQAVIVASFERIAARIGEEVEKGGEGAAKLATEAYRIVLGAADAAERTRAAVRTEDDEAFRGARTMAEATWRSVRARVLGKKAPHTALCLDEKAIAGFVDGTMRGAARARSEGHVGSCARCVDEVATLSTDLRIVPVLRDAAGLDRAVAVAAGCLAATRFEAARRVAGLVRGEEERDRRAARDVERLARAAASLHGGRPAPTNEVSGLVVRGLPSDEEAPLVAFEALARDDAHAAFRAIDDHTARHPVAARLRLLAAGAGEDPVRARSLAGDVMSKPRADRGALEDATCVLALAEGRTLPRESVVERLRDVLPDVIRVTLARVARS